MALDWETEATAPSCKKVSDQEVAMPNVLIFIQAFLQPATVSFNDNIK